MEPAAMDDPGSPTRRLILRLTICLTLAAGTVWAAWLSITAARTEQAVREWEKQALARDLPVSSWRQSDIPGLESIGIAGELVGRWRALVAVIRETDVDELLDLPDCPVRLTVCTGKDITPEQRDKLCKRFGAENVE